MLVLRRCPICRARARGVCSPCRAGFVPAASRVVAPTESVRSLYRYDPTVARAVVAAKQASGRHLWRGFGHDLAGVVEDEPDVITWVPADPRHRRQRGFDQGRLLARALALSCDVPVRSSLVRSSVTQHGRNGAERRSASIVTARRPLSGHVLLVDDVVTTGRSIQRAAEALLAGGAASVRAVTVASVPDRNRGTTLNPVGSGRSE